MQLGTQIKLLDGREATVVYNSLTGIGVKWGLHDPNPEDFEGTNGDTVGNVKVPIDWGWEPDVMLREPEMTERLGMECVGNDYTILRVGLGKNSA